MRDVGLSSVPNIKGMFGLEETRYGLWKQDGWNGIDIPWNRWMIQSFDLKIANHNSNLITIMTLMTLKVNISMEWRKYVILSWMDCSLRSMISMELLWLFWNSIDNRRYDWTSTYPNRIVESIQDDWSIWNYQDRIEIVKSSII